MEDPEEGYHHWYNDRTDVYLRSRAWSDKEDLTYLGYRKITEEQYHGRNERTDD